MKGAIVGTQDAPDFFLKFLILTNYTFAFKKPKTLYTFCI